MQRAQSFRVGGALALFLLTVCVICSTAYSQKPEKPIPNELPRSWNLEEIAKATPPYGTEGPVYVLAWQVLEDDRPWLRRRRVAASALRTVLTTKTTDTAQVGACLRIDILGIVRHPGGKEPEWQLSMIHVLGEKDGKLDTGRWIFHSKRFKTRPGNKELYAALSHTEVGWSFEQENGWKFVSCGVCEKSWQEVIGEKPTRFFGR